MDSEIGYCEVREQLKEAFLGAVRHLTELQALQLDAVAHDDSNFARLEELIERARLAKDAAKYALIAHMEEHCARKAYRTACS